jgi:murein DD-endopeptidase MepM/ murein hydrolase activator NlpD
MSKSKYRFNPETLQLEAVRISAGQRVQKGIIYIGMVLMVSGTAFFLLTGSLISPGESKLTRKINNMNLYYESVNKDLDQMEKQLAAMQIQDDSIYRTIFEAEPLKKSIREAGFGGSDRYKDLKKMPNADLVVSIAQRLDILTNRMKVQSRSYNDLSKMAVNKKHMLASMPAIQPISNHNLERTSSGWGFRIHPIYKIRKFHYGIDFVAVTGTDVYTTGDGVIEKVTSSHDGYGNCIVVNHGFGFKSLYGHLNGFHVTEGQTVKRGDVIGYVGSTGASTAPHLHYEVIRNNEKVNPVDYFFNDLSADEYDRMIKISSNPQQSFD